MNTGIVSIKNNGIIKIRVVSLSDQSSDVRMNDLIVFKGKESLESAVTTMISLPLWREKVERKLNSDEVKSWAKDGSAQQVTEVITLVNLLWRSVSQSVESKSRPDPKKVCAVKVMLIRDSKAILFKVNQ